MYVARDLLLSIGGFFAGVGATVTYYRFRGYRMDRLDRL